MTIVVEVVGLTNYTPDEAKYTLDEAQFFFG